MIFRVVKFSQKLKVVESALGKVHDNGCANK